MLVWTECMQKHNGLEDGMNKGSMKDFITTEQRLQSLSVSRFNWYDLASLVVIIVAIGSLRSWL